MEKRHKKNRKHAVFRYIRKNLTVILMIIMVLITVGTFAWFSVSNNPRVQNLALVADHEGNLMIADDKGSVPADSDYSDVLDLEKATGYDYMQKVRLSPVTTPDGKNFYSPNYDSSTNTVGSVTKIENHDVLINSYIYEKTFYLKASSGDGATGSGSTYDIALAGAGGGTTGTYIIKDDTATGDTSAYAVRIGFTLTDASGNEVTKIYEPNCDIHNEGTDMAEDGVKGTNGYGTYTAVQQNSNGTFTNTGTGTDSEVLFTISENTDVKVTMRVWLEGTDQDCANSIGATLLQGQIQFSSNEVVNTN